MTHATRFVAVAILVALVLCVPVQAQEIPLASNFQFMVLRTVMPLQWDQDDLQSYLRERFEKDGWRFTSSGARTETLYCEFVFRGAGRGGGSAAVSCQDVSGREIVSLSERSGDLQAFTIKGNFEHASRKVLDRFREMRPAGFRPYSGTDPVPTADALGGRTDPWPTAPLVQGSGTAFIVHPDGLLLTAHHVIDGATSISVSCNGEPAVLATVTSSSVATDLAILEASGELGTDSFLRLSSQRVPSLGDTVFTIGYPTPDLLGIDPKYTNGTVSALSGLRGDASFLQISVPIQPGNSGGALVNDDGDVIGVVVATASAPAFIRATDSIPQNINWAVKTAFASVLFEPPPTDRTPAVDADTTVIERVTAATCLVRVTGPAQ
jgi:S1-C subfamily serine protease